MGNQEAILELINLKQHFKLDRNNVVKAVDDVSFKVKKGETFGLVGESGSGKSTTGRTIIRLYEATDGQVIYKGKDIQGDLSKSEIKEVKKDIQMIFQDPQASLNPRMKVMDIIAEGLKAHGLYENDKKGKEVVYELLETVGLNREHASRYPHEFSGGQRQRIGIARALAIEPDFIVADEPISALDVSIQAQIVNLMNKLKEQRGLTYLFIAHDLSMVRYISDRIAVMSNGKIMELADAEELFKNPLHPYTKSLLSAIPLPDPDHESERRRIKYDPEKEHDYSEEKPKWTEVTKDHFVYASESEVKEYKRKIEKGTVKDFIN
ncbi:MAG: ABC transporter ATP-binding protein [Bacillota bacterium]